MKIKNISNRKESQIKNLFDNYEFIAFVSYSNFNQDQIHKFKLFLSELGLSIKFIRNKRLKESLSDTRFKNMNRIFQIKLDENMIFQKITPQEYVILGVLDYLEK